MSVVYLKPNDLSKFSRWTDYNGMFFDIWYENSKIIYLSPKNSDIIPSEIKEFLNVWKNKIKKENNDYQEMYSVKSAMIEFIYKDELYILMPYSLDIDYDSLLEKYQSQIRNDLHKKLGIEYSRYKGFLD